MSLECTRPNLKLLNLLIFWRNHKNTLKWVLKYQKAHYLQGHQELVKHCLLEHVQDKLVYHFTMSQALISSKNMLVWALQELENFLMKPRRILQV